TRGIPSALTRDVLVLARSIEPDSVELVAGAADGRAMLQRTRRNGADLAVHAQRVMRFFHGALRREVEGAALAPIVFSWLHQRGQQATRLDPHDVRDARQLRARLAALLEDERLFVERLDQ